MRRFRRIGSKAAPPFQKAGGIKMEFIDLPIIFGMPKLGRKKLFPCSYGFVANKKDIAILDAFYKT